MCIVTAKEKYGRLLKRSLWAPDDTILKFMGETSETNKDNIDLLFETQKQEGGASIVLSGIAHLHICQCLKWKQQMPYSRKIW